MSSPSLVALMAGIGLGVGVLLNAIVYRANRDHGRPVNVRYLSVEAGAAVLFGALTLRFGLSAELPAYLYLVTVGVALTMIDFDLRRLPDAIILPSYIVTVILLLPAGAASANWYAGVRALTGMTALLMLYFALALAYPNGLGFGDVKLAGLVGLYLGWLSWNALFLTAVGSLLIACVGGTAVQMTRQATGAVAVRITPCLVSAAVLALFLTTPISNWYASLLPA
jgi:leader peptidase (prepilin peptidase)/N-methyltransferase